MRYRVNGTMRVGSATVYRIDDTANPNDNGWIALARTQVEAQAIADAFNAADPNPVPVPPPTTPPSPPPTPTPTPTPPPPAPPPSSGVAVLDDFSQGIRPVPGSDPLWTHYQEGAPGSVAVVNGSLVETVGSVVKSSGGGAYVQFKPKTNGSYAYPNGYASHYILSGSWNPAFNRLTFKVTSNKAFSRASNGSNNIEVGTYIRPHSEPDPNIQGAHYYHQLGINFAANRPVYVFLSDVPQHQVGVQNIAPGKIANYFDNLTRFYFDGIYGGLANAQVTYDDFQFSQVSGEPDVQVASIWATYNGSSYELGWASPENSTLAYTVYCAPVSMHANGLNAGTVCGTTQGTGNTYVCGPYVKTAPMAQPAGGMFFAIVPAGASTFSEIFVPNA